MRKSILVPVLVGTAFLLTVSATFGSEADELREEMKELGQHVKELERARK